MYFFFHLHVELFEGIWRFHLRLHLPADLCHPRLHIPVHHLWFPLPVPPGSQLCMLLLGHRSFLLLPSLLPGGPETGETLPPQQGSPVVSQGGQPQVKPALLHPLPQDHTIPS